MQILTRNMRNLQASKYRKLENSGFGLLEAIISAMILAVAIATSVSVTNKYQAVNYRSSLRQAIAQSVDEDLTEIKLELESYLYQPRTKSLGACYASNTNCQQSTVGVGKCNEMAKMAQTSSSFLNSGIVNLSNQTHQIFKGLKTKPNSDLRKIVSIQKPDAPRQVGQTIQGIDKSIVRIQYTLEGEFAKVLFDSSAKKTIASVDLSPAAHGSCQYQ